MTADDTDEIIAERDASILSAPGGSSKRRRGSGRICTISIDRCSRCVLETGSTNARVLIVSCLTVTDAESALEINPTNETLPEEPVERPQGYTLHGTYGESVGVGDLPTIALCMMC